MFLRVNRSHESRLRKSLGFLPCSIVKCKDFAIVVDVDDDDVDEFMELAEDMGIETDEYDETPQGKQPRRPEPRQMGGEGEWRELI